MSLSDLNSSVLNKALFSDCSRDNGSPGHSSRVSTPPRPKSPFEAKNALLKQRGLSFYIQVVRDKAAGIVKKCGEVGSVFLFGAPRKKPSAEVLLQSQIYVCIEGIKEALSALKRYCLPSKEERVLATGKTLETIKEALFSSILDRVNFARESIENFTKLETCKPLIFSLGFEMKVNLSVIEELIKLVFSNKEVSEDLVLKSADFYLKKVDKGLGKLKKAFYVDLQAENVQSRV